MGEKAIHHRDRAQRDQRTQELLEQAEHAASDDEAARLREEVVLENRSMAIGLARQFDHRGIERDDLHQIAMVGLVQAANRYRPGAGPSFAAFAVPTIRGVLKRYFRDHGWAVRPPRALQDLHSEVRACAVELEQELQCEPADTDVADRLQLPVDDVRSAQAVEQHYRCASLDAPSSSGTVLKDCLCAGTSDPEDDAVAFVLLRDALAQLDRQQRALLRMRFYEDLTQREIGYRLSVSQMQVSRLLKRIFTQLRMSMSADVTST